MSDETKKQLIGTMREALEKEGIIIIDEDKGLLICGTPDGNCDFKVILDDEWEE